MGFYVIEVVRETTLRAKAHILVEAATSDAAADKATTRGNLNIVDWGDLYSHRETEAWEDISERAQRFIKLLGKRQTDGAKLDEEEWTEFHELQRSLGITTQEMQRFLETYPPKPGGHPE